MIPSIFLGLTPTYTMFFWIFWTPTYTMLVIKLLFNVTLVISESNFNCMPKMKQMKKKHGLSNDVAAEL